MSIMRILLAISVVINLIAGGYISSMGNPPTKEAKKHLTVSNQAKFQQSRQIDPTDQPQTLLKELERKYVIYKKESTACKQSLKELEFRLALQKLNDQHDNKNLITIEEDMPDYMQEAIATYSANLKEEMIDDDWSHEVTTALETIIDREKYSDLTITIPINCHSTLCNYEVITMNTQQADQIEALLLTSLTNMLGGQIKLYKHTEQNTENVRIIMYYARAGHPLPALD
jgi:hypothetical protein